MILVFVCTAALVLSVGWSRAGGRAVLVMDEATRFATSAAGIMSAALVSALVLALVTLVAARLDGGGGVARLRLGPTRATAAGLVAAVVGMSSLSVTCGIASDLLGARGHGNLETIAHALERSSPWRFALALATIAIAPGVAEEAFFRGLIQTRLARRWGPAWALVVTAAGFGLIHLDIVQGTIAYIAGLFLGWLAERFGGIRPSMVAHAFNNALFVAAASTTGSVDSTTRAAKAATLATGLLLFVGAVALLQSPLAVAPQNRGSRRE